MKTDLNPIYTIFFENEKLIIAGDQGGNIITIHKDDQIVLPDDLMKAVIPIPKIVIGQDGFEPIEREYIKLRFLESKDIELDFRFGFSKKAGQWCVSKISKK